MTYRHQDKFERADGPIGDQYTTACGGVIISDEAVIPIDGLQLQSGQSPPLADGITALKTQVFYTAEPLDGPNYVVRTTWAHDDINPTALDVGITTPPSFTALARMSKDPLLYDLGTHEEPSCFDQGYGARVTFPLDGSAPVLKIVKFQPLMRLPRLPKAVSVEIDGAIVLAEITLTSVDLNLQPEFSAGSFVYTPGEVMPYKGQWQDMRLRIRRSNDEVILDVYLNDRNLNQPILTYTDKEDPLWGDIGLAGFEFLSATLLDQPHTISPYDISGLSLLRCGLFAAETFLDIRKPVQVTPGSFFTYREVANRVILLVEKNGDVKYNASTNGTTKFNTYLQFVLEAEADIIRSEGYFDWLKRSQKIFLSEDQSDYELPEDFGELEFIRPGNWIGTPLAQTDRWSFNQRLGTGLGNSGRPSFFTIQDSGPNSRPVVRLFPFPCSGQIPDRTQAPYVFVEYYARQLRPDEPDVQIPFIPQQHIDVLIYGAAAHALLLDTDDANSQRIGQIYATKLARLIRANNRQITQRTVLRSAADISLQGMPHSPLTRAAQLGSLLI